MRSRARLRFRSDVCLPVCRRGVGRPRRRRTRRSRGRSLRAHRPRSRPRRANRRIAAVPRPDGLASLLCEHFQFSWAQPLPWPARSPSPPPNASAAGTGTVLSRSAVPAVNLPSGAVRAVKVLYTTRDQNGRPARSTGVVYYPRGAAPPVAGRSCRGPTAPVASPPSARRASLRASARTRCSQYRRCTGPRIRGDRDRLHRPWRRRGRRVPGRALGRLQRDRHDPGRAQRRPDDRQAVGVAGPFAGRPRRPVGRSDGSALRPP